MSEPWLPSGLTVIAGPPRSGRSSAMWALLARLKIPFTVLDCSNSSGVLLRLERPPEWTEAHVVVKFPPNVGLAGRLATAAALGGSGGIAADDLSTCLAVSESEVVDREDKVRVRRMFVSVLALLRWHGRRTGTPSLVVLRGGKKYGFPRSLADAVISIVGGRGESKLEISTNGISITAVVSHGNLSLKFI